MIKNGNKIFISIVGAGTYGAGKSGADISVLVHLLMVYPVPVHLD